MYKLILNTKVKTFSNWSVSTYILLNVRDIYRLKESDICLLDIHLAFVKLAPIPENKPSNWSKPQYNVACLLVMSCACVYWQDVVSEKRADFRLARVSEDRQSRRAGCQPRGSHWPQVAPPGGHVPRGGPRSDRRAQPRHQARTHHGHGEQEEVTKTPTVLGHDVLALTKARCCRWMSEDWTLQPAGGWCGRLWSTNLMRHRNICATLNLTSPYHVSYAACSLQLIECVSLSVW